MFSEADIIAKAWFVVETVNLVLLPQGLSVDKIFLIGSYANGTANWRSDIDFLVQLKGGKRPGLFYPTWKEIVEIQTKLGLRVHVIFGREETQKSLLEKYRWNYKEIVNGQLRVASKLPN